MAPPAGPLPLQFSIQTTTSDGKLTTIASSANATVAYLDDLVQGFQDAINNRVFSASAPAWRPLSDRYEMGSKPPLYIDPAPDSSTWTAPTGIEENLKELILTCEKYPDYHMEFLQRTTQVEEGSGKATTLCVLKVSGRYGFVPKVPSLGRFTEVIDWPYIDSPAHMKSSRSGMPSGVLSEGLMAFDWKQIAGTWRLLRTTCFRGPGGE